MNREIAEFGVFQLTKQGKLIPAPWIQSTADYTHGEHSIHHFIQYSAYERNKQWYIDRGIEQMLIYMKEITHEQVELRATENLSDEEFEEKYKISRWKLIFNKKHSEYKSKEEYENENIG